MAVIVPAFNEAEVIGSVVKDVVGAFPLCIVIDDGSSDGTHREARLAGAQVVRHDINLGQGAALQTGLSAALMFHRVRWIVTFDADGQHRVQDALKLLDRARQADVDLVLGTRFAPGGGSEAGWAKTVLLKTAVRFTRVSSGLQVTDTHNGLRVIDRELAQQIRMREPRMAHASEFLHLVAESGASWVEVPVHIEYTDYSRRKGQPMMNAITVLFDSVFRK